MLDPNYRSTEERAFGFLKRASKAKIVRKAEKGLSYFLKGFYGGIAMTLRIPTTIRKAHYDQTVHDKAMHEGDFNDEMCVNSSIVGGALGVGAQLGAIGLLVNEAFNDDPLPAILAGSAVAATNLASGIYEAATGRNRACEHFRKHPFQLGLEIKEPVADKSPGKG